MDLRPRLHAQHHVVGVRVFAAQVVRVVGQNQRNLQIPLQLEQPLLDPLLVGQPLILNLQVEVAPAENVLVAQRRLLSLVVLVRHQVFAQFAAQAARQTHQALRVLGQIRLADARLAIEAVQRGLRGDPDQVPVALFVLRQHQQVVVVVALRRGAVILVLAHIQLTAQDRLDPLGLGCVKKVHRPVDVAVIGHGDRLLPQRRHAAHQFLDVACPVQQRVLRVQMQMRKFGHGCFQFYSPGLPVHPTKSPIEIQLS